MNNEITLTDLFEVEMLQRLQDSFCKMTGFAAIITDAEGVPVTKGTNFTDFCNKYTRNSPIGCLRCQQCHVMSRHLPAAGQSAFQIWENVLNSEG